MSSQDPNLGLLNASQKLLATGVLALKQRIAGVGHSLILKLDLFVVGFTQ